MIQQIKAPVFAVVTVLALSAVLVASAQAHTFTASSYPAIATGEQVAKHVFTVQGNPAECKKVHFEAQLTGEAHGLVVIPTYKECTAFGIANAAVIMNSCYYEFTGSGNTGATFTNSVHFRCNNFNDTVTINAPASSPLCVVHIPDQTPTNNVVDYANSGGGVLVTSTVSGIHSIVTDIGGFFCPLSNASTDSTGTTVGSFSLLGTGGKTVDVG